MDKILQALLDELLESPDDDARALARAQRRHPKNRGDKQPFYTKAEILSAAAQLELPPARKQALLRRLQVKPIRTQSGVATVTLLTKPWPCPGQCLFCPADVRMPKSYLANEPGAQRAEQNFFDPLLQIDNRLRSLAQMGHNLSKVEVIILGGSWDSYPLAYQRWFVTEVFRALNHFGRNQEEVAKRRAFYEGLNDQLATGEKKITADQQVNAQQWQAVQAEVDRGELSYNDLVAREYVGSERERRLRLLQQASWEELAAAQLENVTAANRNVGLVIETRPDLITVESLRRYRRLGCTKIQIGIQSVTEEILQLNRRGMQTRAIARALALLRLAGFKLHVHFMANLYGATPAGDIADYARLVGDKRFLPDEIKLYPCALLASAPLYALYEAGRYQPYTQEQLLAVLTANLEATPPYVRITRMIRDFSAHDIVAGNKKTNFRQLVDNELARRGSRVQEIRSREIRGGVVTVAELRLDEVRYRTSVSEEVFLQYVTADNRIVGFLRLSLPRNFTDESDNLLTAEDLAALEADDFWRADTAMIREVHVYGVASGLKTHTNAQHLGLGKSLVARAVEIATKQGYRRLRVIAAVGTRGYYEKLGFSWDGWYESRALTSEN